MAETTLTDTETVLGENDVLLPRGWAEASVAQDGDDEPNVHRGRD